MQNVGIVESHRRRGKCRSGHKHESETRWVVCESMITRKEGSVVASTGA